MNSEIKTNSETFKKIKTKKISNEELSKNFNHLKNKEKIKIVCISDTHTHTDNIKIPDGDILIHAGDFSYTGQPQEVKKFAKFLDGLPHKYVIFIAGNHDITFDYKSYSNLKERFKLKIPQDKLSEIKEDLFKNLNNENKKIFYLENSTIELFGYKFYGSPYSPKFYQWAFMGSEENLKKIWKDIPDDIDVLITHGPPKYIGDLIDERNTGSETLLEEVLIRIKPKFHIFGHIHDAYGIYILDDDKNTNDTVFINASILNEEYDVQNEPIIFELSKKDF